MEYDFEATNGDATELTITSVALDQADQTFTVVLSLRSWLQRHANIAAVKRMKRRYSKTIPTIILLPAV